MLISFPNKKDVTIIVFLLLAVIQTQRVTYAKSLASHRKLVKRETSLVIEEEATTPRTRANTMARRLRRYNDRVCGSRLRTAVAMACKIGYYTPESGRVIQRSTREIVIRIPRNIRRECCDNICSETTLLKYCQPFLLTNSTTNSTITISTTSTTESTITPNQNLLTPATESNAVDEENQINLELTLSETTSGRRERNAVVAITDPPYDYIFAVDQETNDAINY